jgi:hypothetical protein
MAFCSDLLEPAEAAGFSTSRIFLLAEFAAILRLPRPTGQEAILPVLVAL